MAKRLAREDHAGGQALADDPPQGRLGDRDVAGGRAPQRVVRRVAAVSTGAVVRAANLAGLSGDDRVLLRVDEIPTLKPDRLLRRLSEGAVRNVRFDDLIHLVEELGFERKRVSGSHHIFIHPEIPNILSLQSVGGEAKPYQVRQVMSLVERYDLRIREP